MSAAVAPGGIIIAIGSPGTILSRTNTTTATPTSVGGTSRNRRTISLRPIAGLTLRDLHLSPLAGRRRRVLYAPGEGASPHAVPLKGPLTPTLSPQRAGRGSRKTSPLREMRQQHAVHLGNDVEPLAIDDRLHVLQQRDDLAFLGDI